MTAGRVCRVTGLAVAAWMLAAWMLAGCAVCDAQQPWPLWTAYKQHFTDTQGRVIDHSASDRTTSEGQAYAMFFALVENDRNRFDRLLTWTTTNLAGGDLTSRLPAWLWGRSSAGEWKTLDENSAADADLWIAYTLLQAGRLWHQPRYQKLGRLLAARIAREEVKDVPGIGAALLPGAHGFQPDGSHFLLNPSYVPLPLITGMAHQLPQGPWASLLSSLPALLAYGPGHGFAMDWLLAGPHGLNAAAPPSGPSAETQAAQPAGSYDAIRVYLWLGISAPTTPLLPALLKQLPGMEDYLRNAPMPPLEVSAQGSVLHADSPIGFSAAVAPYLKALGMTQQARVQWDRVQAARQPGSGLYGVRADYYDQNLVLFSTGWNEQRYRFEASGMLRLNWK